METYCCTRCGVCDTPEVRQNGPHKSGYCKGCGKWITHIRQQPDDDFTLFFGKFKGRNVKSMLESKEEREYLVWLYSNATSLKQNQKLIIANLIHV